MDTYDYSPDYVDLNDLLRYAPVDELDDLREYDRLTAVYDTCAMLNTYSNGTIRSRRKTA